MKKPDLSNPQPGFNLICDPQLYTGLGEAARGLLCGAAAAGLQHRIVALTYPSNQRLPKAPAARGGREQRLNVMAFNPQGLPSLPRFSVLRALRGWPTAAAWHWELEDAPRRWHPWLRMVDEVWAPTQFVARSLRQLGAAHIRVQPPAIDVSMATGALSSLLPSRRPIFVCAFNPASCMQRKNPLGAVEAFRRAFGEQIDGPLLLVKTHDLAHYPAVRDALMPALQQINAKLIDNVLTRRQWLDLLMQATAFVSLHRSEGLGLAIAEAMALGKPVIASRYGGNLDFMDEDCACLVPAERRTITADDHRVQPAFAAQYRPGMHWAEPDLDAAAVWLRRLAQDNAWVTQLGARARLRVHVTLDPAVVGTQLCNALVGLAAHPRKRAARMIRQLSV